MNQWIDTHCHIDQLSGETSSIMSRAFKAGVFKVLTIGTQLEDWPKVLALCESSAPEIDEAKNNGAKICEAKIYGALGMHPHYAKNFNSSCEDFLKKHLTKDPVVAVGEIGLDYYYEHSPQEKQKEVFETQLALAKEFHLPVEIHTREAEQDTGYFLKKYQGLGRGLLHCFTSSYNLAKKALDCGYNISFSGIITFKKSEELRETCKKIPLDRLHIETDAPFLSPEPHRGKENQPAYVPLVAQCVAQLHGVSLEDLSHQLKQNTWDLFPKMKPKEEF